MKHLSKIQEYLKENKLDAWVVYQFMDINPMFKKFVGSSAIVTRRAFLIIPQKGTPFLFHSFVDSGLGHLGIDSESYISYEEFKQKAKAILKDYKKIAMEFSPMSEIPHISKVDAGVIDLLRSFKLEIVSSGDLMQLAGQLSDEDIKSHKKATKALDEVRRASFKEIEDLLKSGKKVDEYLIQQLVLLKTKEGGLEPYSEPTTVINEHSAILHYAPPQQNSKELRENDLLLIDMWAKLPGDEDIYADITWMLYRGKDIPKKIQDTFDIVITARDKAVEFLRSRVKKGEETMGWEVDKVARDHITKMGYGQYFSHRLGHSIDTHVHGQLTHLDNFENKDSRKIFPNHITSIEPGIYIPGEFGIRSEINIVVTEKDVEITTEVQKQIHLLP